MGITLFEAGKVVGMLMRVKIRVCGCKWVRGGQSYSSVRTHYNTKSEYAQRLSRAYRKQDGREMDLY